jgi:competence protein ComEC
MNSILFYTVVIGLTSGILFRSFFDIRLPDLLFILFISFALAVVWRIKERSYTSVFLVTSIFLLTLSIGSIRFELSDHKVSPLRNAVGVTKKWEGIVAREPDERQTSKHLYVRESETDVLILVIADPFVDVSYGDRISVKGTLKTPESFETDTGRTFEYPGYLRARGVREVISYGEIEVLEEGKGNVVMSRLLLVKQSLMQAIERAIPEPSAGLGEGILLGVKRAIGESLTDTFRAAGIIHIVVLSGYNIMIVADSVMRFLGYLFFPRTRLIIGISTVILFALLVGLSATVVRASIMASLVLIARSTGRHYAILRALCLTGLVMLFINPYLLAFDPGFQLSFLATLGLILLAPEFEKRFTYIPTLWGIRGYLASTIGTQIYVLPILLYSMGAVSLVGILVNVLVLPLVPVAMFATFVVGIVGLVSEHIALVLGFGAHIILSYIIKVAEIAAALPFAEVSLPSFHASIVAVMFAFIGFFTYTWKTKKDSSVDTNIVNDYADWVIETEKETPPRTQNVRGGVSDVLPFK